MKNFAPRTSTPLASSRISQSSVANAELPEISFHVSPSQSHTLLSDNNSEEKSTGNSRYLATTPNDERYDTVTSENINSNSNNSSLILINEKSHVSNQTRKRKIEPDPEALEEEPPAKIIKKTPGPFRDERIGKDIDTCSVCLKLWEIFVKHRLTQVASKCGNPFEARYDEQWLLRQSSEDKSCPSCKEKTTNEDFHKIFTGKTSADNFDITALKKKRLEIQMEQNRLKMDLQKEFEAYQMVKLNSEMMLRNSYKKLDIIGLQKEIEIINMKNKTLNMKLQNLETTKYSLNLINKFLIKQMETKEKDDRMQLLVLSLILDFYKLSISDSSSFSLPFSFVNNVMYQMGLITEEDMSELRKMYSATN